ncbi:TIR domain-containing protein [Nocardiopsis quinghaiensis]|uniref:TIR domain-containing protein n=1 Tax=Nocardiopsis quinghaiensis TaxID=464995 RepID=UPI0016803E3D|nr:nucleotide-binding protein [Nocardiopsis quinghaiensis]
MTVKRRLPESQIRAQVQEAIEAGTALSKDTSDVTVFRTAFDTWDKRNEIVLESAFEKTGWLDSTPKDQYVSAIGLKFPLGTEGAEEVTISGLASDMETKIARLQRVLDTLDVYEGPADDTSTDTEVTGPATIFVVHGRATTPRLEVENLVRRATRIEPVVLADQISGGAVTLIEKLEEHLGENSNATFAVIVMTGDDIGQLNEEGEELRPRARQNVVLELGYAMGTLGRRRVAILHQDGLELPSDIAGVAYYPLDTAGAWKTRLLGELKAAGITVDADALLS